MKKRLGYYLILLLCAMLLISCSAKKPAQKINNNDSAQAIPQTTVLPQSEKHLKETQPLPNIPVPSPTVTSSKTPAVSSKAKAKKEPIASYSTPIINKDKDRISNINLAIKKINNYRLQSGEIFSFNSIVGRRDAENGFKVAAVIVKGEYGEDMGGGVCQLSSTMFNAAAIAGMEIVERHRHSKQVSYLPEGRDAAVSYPYLDFKFKNTKSYTVKITAGISKNTVVVSIWKA